MPISNSVCVKTILILAAIPNGLRLDKEIRSIEECIRRAVNRDLYKIISKTAVRPQDIRRAIAEEKPQIVHFCGHGLEDGSLLLEDDLGQDSPVSPQGLAALFELHANNVDCVLLNACHSVKSAEAISKYINYAIGMNQKIQDNSAIQFSQGFYDGLGYETSENQDRFQRAFKEGLVALKMENLSSAEIPVLIKKKTLNQSISMVSSQSSSAVEDKQELNDVDRETLTELLQFSGRATSERRRALSLEIGINPGEITAIWLLSENDFAVEFIDLLHKRKLQTAIFKLCKKLESDFKGGGYSSKLETIIAKVNC